MRQAGDELRRQTNIIDQLTSEKSELEAEQQRLRDLLNAQQGNGEDVQQLRRQLAEASQQAEQAAAKNDQLNGVITEKAARVSDLERQLSSLAPLETNLKTAREMLDQQKAEALQHKQFVAQQQAEIEKLRQAPIHASELQKQNESLVAQMEAALSLIHI